MTAWYFIFFFFQAEDGIRDLTVTGVQTCALPISSRPARDASEGRRLARERRLTEDDDREASPRRSEEHTSELQSQSNLVCRLLLEKKKKPTDSMNVELSWRLDVMLLTVLHSDRRA